MKIVVAAGRSPLSKARRTPWPEAVLLLVAVGVYLALPGYLSLGSYVLVMCLFALSLDLVLGIAGIVTLGHSIFFGVGAYAAGLISIAGWQEPLSGVLAAGACAALLALLIGPFILRISGLALVIITVTLCVGLHEAANKMGWLTGGDNGLQGVELAPVLGRFEWSVWGTTEFFYALAWLLVMMWLARRIAYSSFGVALRGIRENPLRMNLVGSPVLRHMVAIFVISAFFAGVAGALLAQTTKFVGLEVLSVETSIDAVVMLVLGGVGQLWGALLGTPLYLLVKDLSKQWNPNAWMIAIGLLLIFVMLFARGGMLGLLRATAQRIKGRT
jgi:branched-chain amino acid transport system permease protein